MTWSASGCGEQRTVTATLTLTNNAPTSGLTSYVNGRLDKPDYPVGSGDNAELVSYYATQGARFVSATLDGLPVAMTSLRERGLPLQGDRFVRRLAQLQQRGPGRSGPQVAEGAVLDRCLIDPELGVASQLGRGRLARPGLVINHPQRPVGMPFEPVHPSLEHGAPHLDKRVDLIVLLRLHGQYDFSGTERQVIGLKHDEMQILRAAKKRLQTHSTVPLHHKDAVAMALMRMARPEFSRDGLIPSPLTWPEGARLQP